MRPGVRSPWSAAGGRKERRRGEEAILTRAPVVDEGVRSPTVNRESTSGLRSGLVCYPGRLSRRARHRILGDGPFGDSPRCTVSGWPCSSSGSGGSIRYSVCGSSSEGRRCGFLFAPPMPPSRATRMPGRDAACVLDHGGNEHVSRGRSPSQPQTARRIWTLPAASASERDRHGASNPVFSLTSSSVVRRLHRLTTLARSCPPGGPFPDSRSRRARRRASARGRGSSRAGRWS